MSWEKYVPTSDSQLERLARLKVACGGEEAEAVRRNVTKPAQVPTLGSSAKPAGIAALYKESYATGLGNGDKLGERAKERTACLREYAQTCHSFVADIERAVHLLDSIAQQQEQVTTKTQALHATCESLLSEQHRLEAQVKALSYPLQRFGALDELGPALGLPFAGSSRGGQQLPPGVGAGVGGVVGPGIGSVPLRRNSSGSGGGRVLLHPGSEAFAEALGRAASCMEYLQRHPEFMESQQYAEKYSQLLSRAEALVKNQVVEYLEQAARLSAEKPVAEGRLETSEIYSRFRSVSHRVNAGVRLMRKYVSSAPLIKTLLAECRQLYFEKRLALLRPAVRTHLEAMSKQRGLTAMIRFGAAFLVRVGQLETQLYDSCLGTSGNSDYPRAKASNGWGLDQESRSTKQNSGKRQGTAANGANGAGNGANGGVSQAKGGRPAAGGGEEGTENGEGGGEEGIGDRSDHHHQQQQQQEEQEEKEKEEKDKDGDEDGEEEELAGRAGLYNMLLQLCSELHKHLRPKVFHGSDMDTLCELVSVIRDEIVEEQRGRHGSSQSRPGIGDGEPGGGEVAIETVLMKLVQDSQERLIYMATKVIQDDIENFTPIPEQLDYPGLLMRAREEATKNASSRTGGLPSQPELNREVSSSSVSSGRDRRSRPPPGTAYVTWYPPLKSTLLVLSKVYRAVDMGVFEDLAQLAVAACAESLKKASISIDAGASPGGTSAASIGSIASAAGAGGAKPGGGSGGGSGGGRDSKDGAESGGPGSLDAQLFLIKHFLTLREQLTPFHIQFVKGEKKLNFDSTRMALRKFIRQTPSLFRLSRKNALVELTVESIPTIDEIQIDAKGEMEASLKSACSAFISCAVELTASPLLAWVSKARAFEERGVDGLEKLQQQPFASPERVKEMAHAALFSATAALPQVCSSMSLYLDNPATEGILIHPVQRRVLDAVETVRDVLQRLHTAKDLEGVMPLLAQVAQTALAAGEAAEAPPSPSERREALPSVGTPDAASSERSSTAERGVPP